MHKTRRALIEALIGPCTRSEAEAAMVAVREVLDERFPSLVAAVGVKLIVLTPVGGQEDTKP